jgi:hypothetical protein
VSIFINMRVTQTGSLSYCCQAHYAIIFKARGIKILCALRTAQHNFILPRACSFKLICVLQERFLSAPVNERVLLRLLVVIQSHLLQVSGIPPHTHYSSPPLSGSCSLGWNRRKKSRARQRTAALPRCPLKTENEFFCVRCCVPLICD